MTLSKKSFLYIFMFLAILSCSDDDEPTLESRLVDGNWTGWYEINESSIVFSVEFHEDKTLKWYRLNAENGGSWSVDGNVVTANLENGSTITGTFEGDSIKDITSDVTWKVHDFRESGELPSM
jgi:hypothetical protein